LTKRADRLRLGNAGAGLSCRQLSYVFPLGELRRGRPWRGHGSAGNTQEDRVLERMREEREHAEGGRGTGDGGADETVTVQVVIRA
jgi:hypothetical protein